MISLSAMRTRNRSRFKTPIEPIEPMKGQKNKTCIDLLNCRIKTFFHFLGMVSDDPLSFCIFLRWTRFSDSGPASDFPARGWAAVRCHRFERWVRSAQHDLQKWPAGSLAVKLIHDNVCYILDAWIIHAYPYHTHIICQEHRSSRLYESWISLIS